MDSIAKKVLIYYMFISGQNFETEWVECIEKTNRKRILGESELRGWDHGEDEKSADDG